MAMCSMTLLRLVGVAMFMSTSQSVARHNYFDASLPLLPGKAIDVFSRFGFLNLGVRVLPGRDEGKWTFREPTFDAFQNVSIIYDTQDNSEIDLNFEYCDDLHSLLRAFFIDFSLERSDEPWRAYVSGWPDDVIARELGIDPSFLHEEYCYALARVSRIRSSAQLHGWPGVPLDALRVDSRMLEFDNATAVSHFITKYGSHYIRSYRTGNSVYQVFVYTKDACRAMRIGKDFTDNNVDRSSQEHAVHVGEIKVASDNKTVEDWLRGLQKVGRRPGLLRLRQHPALHRRLHALLGDEAVLCMHLDTLSAVFEKDKKVHKFTEVIDNYLKLWDINA